MPALTPAATNRFSLLDVVLILREWRYLAIGIVVVYTLLGVSYLQLATSYYRATVTLVVRSQADEGAGAQALLGRLGGLAGLGGLSSPASEGIEEMAWLTSRQFGERVITAENLMPQFFPGKWDATLGRWREDLAPAQVPTLEDGWRYLDDRMRTVSRDRRTGIVTLQVRWKDPKEAARLANLMVTRANDELRQRSIAEADTSIKYLQRELEVNSAVALQQGIYRLIEMQIQRKVVANSRPDFAFSVLDPAAAPDPKRVDFPRGSIVIGFAVFASFIFAGVAVFLAELIAPRRPARRA